MHIHVSDIMEKNDARSEQEILICIVCGELKKLLYIVLKEILYHDVNDLIVYSMILIK